MLAFEWEVEKGILECGAGEVLSNREEESINLRPMTLSLRVDDRTPLQSMDKW